MTQFKKAFTNKVLLCFILSLVGFYSGWLIESYAHQTPDVAAYKKELEEKLHQAETEIEGLFNNGSFLLNAVEGYVLIDTVNKYINSPFTFIIYNDKDSIVYWNNSDILPFQSDIRYTLVDTIEKYEIGESIFLKIHRPYDFLIDGVTYYYNLEALIPLYRHYSINNDYLSANFPIVPKQFSEFITVSKEKNEYSINDRLGRPIFYIKAKENYPYHWFIVFSTLLYYLSSFLQLLMIHYIAKNLSRKGFWISGFSFLAINFLFFRLITIFYDYPLLVHEYQVFAIRLSDANTFWFYSLGDFLIDIALLFWAALFVSREFRVAHLRKYNLLQKNTFALVTYFIVIGGMALIQFAIRDIVMTSYISFEFDNSTRLDFYSLLALMGIGTAMLSYFVITYRLFSLMVNIDLGFNRNAILFASSLLFILVVAAKFNYLPIDMAVFAVGSIAHTLTMTRFVKRDTSSLLWLTVWLFLFCGLGAIMLENANIDKSIILRKDFAKALAFERDLETENTFNTLIPKILEDDLLQISINNPLSPSPRKQAIDLLTYRYLDNYFFGRYDYTVHIYTDQARPYRGEKRDYEELMNTIKSSQKTTCQYLQFYSDPDGDFSYFAQLPITQNGSLLAVIIVELKPKKEFKRSNIYVELLSRNKDKLENIYAQFNYALYKFDERVLTNGTQFKAELAYNLPRPEKGEYRVITTENEANNNYLVYRNVFDGNSLSMVKVPKQSMFEALAVFAYIFCFGIFLLILGMLLDFIFHKITKIKLITIKFENSLREQIQRGIIVVTLASFVAIAIITIQYYSTEYDDYHKSRLFRKINSTARTATWQIDGLQELGLSFPEAAKLSDIQQIDVNVYDLGGNLISSSEEAVFERHLISRKMNPSAFQRLRHEQQFLVTQTEIISNFEYLSAYIPLKDRSGNVIAYLNLPYDLAGSHSIGSQDLTVFLGALLNVYVIFLLIAGLAAFFIARSVTNPLSVIGAKLNKIELGKTNEPIIWDNNDEIGELVERYNIMIKELEESTKDLARSQRESAWREMAKQIAHEIKNPLTPMKLNIQLLERVVNSNPEKAQQMVGRVTKTLVEQIDSLAHIASEFSNFAKMPTANNEQLNLNELVINAYNLFKEEKQIELISNITEKECTIFADKTQMMRVLNNLLKNAIQAIPDDQEGIINIKLEATSKMAIISVSDNGCGIPEAQKDDIFVPNFTTKTSGTGIGLAMSKNIVETAKGFIYFEPNKENGTTFFVEIPLFFSESFQ